MLFSFVLGCNYGYAHFASREAADSAINVLNGVKLAGMTIKIMRASNENSESYGYNSSQMDNFSQNNESQNYTSYSDIPLPSLKPTLNSKADYKKRLFFVANPKLSIGIMNDLYARFGSLIYIGYVKGKRTKMKYLLFSDKWKHTYQKENSRNNQYLTLRIDWELLNF